MCLQMVTLKFMFDEYQMAAILDLGMKGTSHTSDLLPSGDNQEGREHYYTYDEERSPDVAMNYTRCRM